ncbi:VCBS repeat-containing protein [Aliiroseovarius sp. S1339]|uniref:VCBS repeat-containing protein n=1 Tax=Aliiroseovarius sp. S1339 TaxID=2936990 RepID=UPI0020BDC084|nr:VCBS repeat-containing protein [Aliiroseovarius sp. S1339]MCK8464311.1 VCBS repeat-containing protein [Aliiroseovarius sp. S1339]
MVSGAPRLPSFLLRPVTRGAVHLLCMVAVLCGATAALGQTITDARYTEPTDRYAHGVLGDAIEWGAIELSLSSGERKLIRLPDHMVFEDLAPRLHDLDQDGDREVIVVLTHADKGAALAVFDENGLVAQTDHIGQRNRWLAPAGVGDFLRDKRQLIAYVDRPHLKKELKIVVLEGDRLIELASVPNLTNHRIGDDFIIGGVRNCGDGDMIVTLSGDLKYVTNTRTSAGGHIITRVAQFHDLESFDPVMGCEY